MGQDRVMRLPGLDGLRVAVTAGAGGIGLCIARTLIGQGARVAVCDVDESALATVRSELDVEVAEAADVSNDRDVERFFTAIEAELGGLDALVNNAGIAGPTGGIETISPAEWRRCIDICLTGQFLCGHFAVPLLKAAGDGAIINISSAAGRFGYAFRTPYSSAKWGVIGFTQSLAKELGPDNIRVNAILPGIIEGPRMDGVIAARATQTGVTFDDMKSEYLSRISLRRMTPPQDVADMAAFLISSAGRNISGQSLPIDGNVESL